MLVLTLAPLCAVAGNQCGKARRAREDEVVLLLLTNFPGPVGRR